VTRAAIRANIQLPKTYIKNDFESGIKGNDVVDEFKSVVVFEGKTWDHSTHFVQEMELFLYIDSGQQKARGYQRFDLQ
jgi:hypothetical protein